jgi:GNAT superfamily N-acetyltransferase
MILIRSARTSDRPSLVRFNQALARETEAHELSGDVLDRGIRRLMDQPAYGFYVVATPKEQPDEVIGCTMITYEWSDWRDGVIWWIQSVYVERNWRGQGVFRSLLTHLEDRARREPDVRGLRLYVEDANHHAHRTYDRLGLESASYSVRQKLF